MPHAPNAIPKYHLWMDDDIWVETYNLHLVNRELCGGVDVPSGFVCIQREVTFVCGTKTRRRLLHKTHLLLPHLALSARFGAHKGVEIVAEVRIECSRILRIALDKRRTKNVSVAALMNDLSLRPTCYARRRSAERRLFASYRCKPNI